MIGFAGLSHLGIVSSIATASKGFEVLGFDPNADLTQRLSRGELPLMEPGLPELLNGHRKRLTFSAEAKHLAKCKIIYLSQDVPTDANNRSDLSGFAPLFEQVIQHAAPGTILVLLSQVPPGFTRTWAQRLERDFPQRGLKLYYQVETLIFGRAVERATLPERFMVGCQDPQASLPQEYDALLQSFGCPVFRMRLESAELCKISINCCLVAMVSVANTLAEVCEKIGADWSEIVPTLKLDRRIGPHAYLAPGLGLSGGNLERDLISVQNLAQEWGTEAGVVDAWLANSRYRRDWVFRILHEQVLSRKPSPVVAVWGLAYKENTDSTRNSPSLELLRSLQKVAVQAYDPQVRLKPGQLPNVGQAGNALDACQGADALAIMTPWAEFQKHQAAEVARRMSGKIIVDPLGVLAGQDWRKHGCSYYRLGSSPYVQEAA